MQKFVIAFIALCQVVGVAAQVRYTGQVLDERDIPLIAVNIVLGDDQAFGTTTDAEGRFTLNGLRGGAQRLRMSHVGHVMIDTLITGEQHTDQVFRMRLDVVMMRAAEITALRVGDAPFAKSIVSKEDIAKINTGVDLPYLLDLQPSVVTTSDAGTGIGYTGMRIRGTDATRTNITLNGVPFNDPGKPRCILGEPSRSRIQCRGHRGATRGGNEYERTCGFWSYREFAVHNREA
ncbi:MAG: carboxypeptidase-like regulatory domain-containing protein [Flavobacteriales bacterium]|nr:carboxypeptidase-like regulatory domain-containing protein [Flavobacteriales bacterium]